MDKKLEARIARLEKLLSKKSVKNEEFSKKEEMAREAVRAAKEALSGAIEACRSLDLEDQWSNVYWDKVANQLETADSYMPRFI